MAKLIHNSIYDIGSLLLTIDQELTVELSVVVVAACAGTVLSKNRSTDMNNIFKFESKDRLTNEAKSLIILLIEAVLSMIVSISKVINAAIQYVFAEFSSHLIAAKQHFYDAFRGCVDLLSSSLPLSRTLVIFG
ncbi:hypothetical protein GQX74_012932 [Glossina fuscipes]|nr:hypothetical protein GQX74_012932 [Glossina fuscipes]